MSGIVLQPNASVRRPLRPLLSTCALATAMVALGHVPVRAQSYLGSFGAPQGASVDNSITGQTRVSVTAPTAIINWTPTDTAAGASPITFQNAGTTAVFEGTGTGYTVLNRIVPTGAAADRSVLLNGNTQSFLGTQDAGVRGGSIWFFSPNGLILGSQASIDVGNLLLTTRDIPDADFLDENGQFNFGQADNSRARITISGADADGDGASIIARNDPDSGTDSYVAILAPRITQAGTVRVNGTAAYVAAEEATLTIPGGLFDLQITSGSSVDSTNPADNEVLTHTGTTNFEATASNPSAYMVAVPKNLAVTMLVGGEVGFDASSASAEGGTIVLSAGFTRDADTGNFVPSTGTGVAADVTLGGTFRAAATTVYARREALAAGDITTTGDLTIHGGQKSTLRTGAQTASIGGNLRVVSLNTDNGNAFVRGTAAIDVTGGTLTAGGDIIVDASQQNAGTATGGFASVTVDGGSLTANSLVIDADGIGANARIDGDAAGNGVGGAASLTLTSGPASPASIITRSGEISIRARGIGGTTDPSFDPDGAIGGSGTGGTASLTMSGAGGTLSGTIVTVTAAGQGGAGGRSGDSAFAGGNGGSGTGGGATASVSGGSVTATDFTVSAAGIGGDGGDGEFGYGSGPDAGNAGAATGGNATLTVGGAYDVATTTVDVSAIAGSAGTANDPASIDGSGASATAGGSSGTGGATLSFLTDAIVTGGGSSSPTLNVDARASATGGLSGGSALGGRAVLNSASTAPFTVATATLDSRATAGSSSAAGAAGGNAASGSVTLEVTAGTLTINNLTLGLDATGGSATAGAGGDGTGGNGLLRADGGTLGIGNAIALDATGRGGFGATAGGDGTGGSAAIAILNGGTLAYSAGAISLSANGIGGATNTGSTPGAAGNGTGGTVSLALAGTTLAISDLTLSATASGTATATTGGTATGGTISVTTSDNGVLTLTGGLSADASADGGTGRTGGSATGGDITVTLASGGDITVPGSLTLDATAFGGRGAWDGNGGAATGGSILIGTLAGATGSTLTVGSALNLFASAAGGISDTNSSITPGGSGGNGGAATGGDVRLQALAGTVAITGRTDGRAGATGGETRTGGIGGAATGGDIALEVAGGSATFGDIDLFGTASGGNGSEIGYGLPGADGAVATGGMAQLLVSGGTLTAGSVALSGDAFGGDGGRGFDGADGGAGGNAAAGSGLAQLSGGTTTLTSLSVSARAEGGTGGSSVEDTAGGAGGNATGGADVRLDVSGGATLSAENLSVIASADGGRNGSGGSATIAQGNGGGGTAGQARILLAEGSITAGSATIDAHASGGLVFYDSTAATPPPVAGSATAGTARLQITGGSAGFDTLFIDASADGGRGRTALSGSAQGGTAGLSVDGGSLSISDGLALTARADGTSGLTGPATQLTGGTASFSASDSATLDFGFGDLLLDAAARIVDDESGNSGGQVTGGTATLSLDGAELAFEGALTLDASAGGENRGVSGTGGTASLTVANNGALSALSVTLDASGSGTNAAEGAAGGSGRGGDILLAADGGRIDGGNIVLDASGSGGNDLTSGVTGLGQGGDIVVSVLATDDFVGSLAATDLTADTSGTGGSAVINDGGDDSGRSGAAGTGGTVSLSTVGDFAVGGDLLIDASGIGGDSFAGGTGGTGTGGTVGVTIAASTLETAGQIGAGTFVIDASGTGGTALENDSEATSGGVDLTAASGGSGAGGNVTLTTSAGAITAGALTISTGATGADGRDDLTGEAGGNGGSATAGSLSLVAGAGTLDAPLAYTARATAGRGGNGGAGSSGGNAGDATAGSFSYSLVGDDLTLDLAALSFDFSAVAGQGGDAANASSGNGGNGGRGGSATGGSLAFSVDGVGSSLNIDGIALTASAEAGRGGNGGSGAGGGAGGTGGNATGGSLSLTVANGTLSVGKDDGTVTATLSASAARGGDSGDGSALGNSASAGGNGGNALGGSATFASTGGTLGLGDVSITAYAFGGEGGGGGTGGGTPAVADDPQLPGDQSQPAVPFFASVGEGGDGINGAIRFETSDVVGIPLLTVADLVVDTRGFAGTGSIFGDSSVGAVVIRQGSSDAEAAMRFGGIDIFSLGATGTNDAGITIASNGGTLSVDRSAFFDTGGDIFFEFAGDGQFDVGSSLFASGQFVGGSHIGRGEEQDSIRAGSAFFSGFAVSLGQHIAVRSDEDITISAGGGGAVLANATALGDIRINSEGAVDGGTWRAGDDILVDALSISVTSALITGDGIDDGEVGYGFEFGYGGSADGRNISLVAVQGIAIGAADAIDDILISSAGGSIEGGAISAGDDVIISGDSIRLDSATARGSAIETGYGADGSNVRLTALAEPAFEGNTVDVALIEAANDISITAGGATTLGTATAGGTINISAALLSATELAAGNDVVVGTAGSIGVARLNAGGNANLDSTAGPVEVTEDIVVGGDIIASGASVALRAVGDLNVASVTATDGDIMLMAGGSVGLDQVSASNGFAAYAGGSIDVANDLTAGRGVILLANGNIAGGNVTSGRNLSIFSEGAVTFADLTSTAGSVRVSGRNDIALGDVRAAGSIGVKGFGAITIGDATAGTDPQAGIDLDSGSADPVVPGIATGFDDFALSRCDDSCTLSSIMPFMINFFGQVYDSTFVSNNGYVTFGAGQATFTPTGLGSGYSGLPIIAAFFADVDTRNPQSALTTYGAGTYAGRSAFGVTYDNVGYFSSRADKLNSFQIILTNRADTGTGNFDIYYNYTNITWETGSASGGINGFGGTSAAVGFNAGRGNAPGTFYELPGSLVPGTFLNNGTAPLITTTNNGNPGQLVFQVRGGQVSTGPEAPTVQISNRGSVAENRTITLGNLSGEGVSVTGAGDVVVGNVDVGDRGSEIAPAGQVLATSLDAAGSLRAGSIMSGGLVALGADQGDLLAGPITTAGSVVVLAGGNVELGAVTTGTGAADGLFISGRDVLGTGAFQAFDFATLLSSPAFSPAGLANATPTRTGGAISLQGPITTGNFAASGGGIVDINAIDATGRAFIDSGTAVTLGPVLAGGDVDISANGLVTLAGDVDGANISVASRDIVIALGEASPRIGIDTDTISFTKIGSGPMNVGGGDVESGWFLSNAEFGRVSAHRIEFNATAAEDGYALVVGDLDVVGAAGADAGARRRNLTGSELVFNSATSLLVNGAVALTAAGADDSVTFNAVDLLFVDTATGSIRLGNANGGLGGQLILDGGTVFVGSQDALAFVQDPARTTDARNERLGRNDGATRPEGYLQADAIELRGSSGIYVQNSGTNSQMLDDRAGLTAGFGGITLVTKGGDRPTEIIINGRRSSTDGGFVTGADLLPLVTLRGQGNAQMASFNPRSTINGCLIVGVSCRFNLPENPGVPQQDIINEVMTPDRDFDGETSLVQALNTPVIQFAEIASINVLPVIEEPVTGAGNEDLWMGAHSDGAFDINQQVTGTRNDDEEDDSVNQAVTGTRNDAQDGDVNQPVTGSRNENRDDVDQQVTGTRNDTQDEGAAPQR